MRLIAGLAVPLALLSVQADIVRSPGGSRHCATLVKPTWNEIAFRIDPAET